MHLVGPHLRQSVEVGMSRSFTRWAVVAAGRALAAGVAGAHPPSELLKPGGHPIDVLKPLAARRMTRLSIEEVPDGLRVRLGARGRLE
jgi:hypothetical protein